MPERSPRGRSRELTEGADSRARGRGRGGGCGPGVRWRGGWRIRLWGEGEMPGEKPKQTLLLPALRGAPRDASQGPLVATVSGGGLLFPWTPLQGSCRDVGASAQATAGSSLPQCARRGPPVPSRRSTSSESDAAAQLRDLESGPRKGSFPFRAHRSLQITDIRVRLANKQLIQVSINAAEREQKG